MVLAFIIRLIAGYLQSFSNDELSAIYRLQFNNFSDLIHWGIKVDGHPALVQLFLYYYVPLCGKSELFIRLPFILASTLSLAFVFFSLKKLSGTFTANMVIIILALSGFSIQLGYFARPYAFAILFTSAAAYYWIRVFIDKDASKKYLVAFILFSVLAAYSHYFALLEIVMLGMATFVFSSRKLWLKMILTGVICLVAYLPNYPILSFQMAVGGIGGWLGKPKDYFMIDLLLEYFDRSPIIITVFILFPMLIVIIKPSLPSIKKTALLLFLSVIPFTILYFYSIKINSVLQFSACFFLMPFFLAAFFSLFETGEEQPVIAKWGYMVCTLVFLSSTFFFHNVFAPIHFAEFKKIAEYIEAHESDAVTTVVAVNNPFYIDYYLKDKKPDLYITDMGDDLSFLKRYIDTCKTQGVIYAFANQRSNLEIPFLIASRFIVEKKKQYYPNSELYHWEERNKYNSVEISEPFLQYSYYNKIKYFHPDSVVLNLNPEGGWLALDSSNSFYGFMLDSSFEFSPALEIELKNTSIQKNDIVMANAGLWPGELCEIELVITVERNGKTVFWRSRKWPQQFGRPPYIAIDGSAKSSAPYTIPQDFFVIAETFNQSEIDLKTDVLKVYVWNPNRCNCYVFPFRVRFYHGNPFTVGYSQ